MPKNLFQDMVKIKKEREAVRYTSEKESEKEVESKPRSDQRPRPESRHEIKLNLGQGKKEGGSRYGLWFVAVISIVFFLFALSFLFARAEVTVNPKVKDFTLDDNLSAIKDSSTDDLSFDLVVISGEESKKVVAGEAQEVALKSEGTVLIYNSFSSVPQKLLIDTRLEGSNGKIYKTKSAVTVPGMTGDIPGQTEASVYGEEAGEEYNSDPLDFKIFGFKGTPKYSKFFARSKGSITGGFKGNSPVVSEVDKEKTFSELKTVLKEKLFQKVSDQIPAGFVLFKDAVFLNIDEQSVEFASTDGLPLKMKGTLYGFLFSEEELTKKIAENNIPQYDGSAVFIPNIGDLTFSLSTSGVSFADIQNINFRLSGPTNIVWKFDDTKLASELLGKSKKDFAQILAQYPNVDSAQLVLSPFWVRTFPDKSKDIKVIVSYPK